ncbi:MAG: metal ABC transporter ATP-binding protein [Bdellovibrionales bacterium]|nr:metal ABC transporter ATP-binding protein [Bdellovibrionales bacterium]
MERAALSVSDLTVSYRHKPVLWSIHFEIPQHCLCCIVGPNGAGKSTLLKACLDLVPSVSGEVRFFGEQLNAVRHKVAYVPQREEVDWDFPVSVLEVVLMGRRARLPFYRPVSKADRVLAEESLDKVGMLPFAERQIQQLSGGQQQRVFLARALCQGGDLFLLDEPFAGVDATSEGALVELFQLLVAQGKTVICVHHDLNTAPVYFNWAVLLNLRLIASGPIENTLTEETIKSTYGGQLAVLTQVFERLRKEQLGSQQDRS